MPHFEVFIPAKDADSFNVQLTVQANNWLGALRLGLANIGEGPNTIANILCDIKEDASIHVTDPGTGRVFRLREVPAPG
ncbi:MAG: GAF domain-containing protein, partial [Myxococcota bacterium]